tara:strand:- start:1007 stop:1582 length:576 start_codon:yes stop_codon:yes gene_type:complete
MWKYKERIIAEGRAWTDDNGIQHPANWSIWSPSQKESVGLSEVTPDAPPDSRLYIWGYKSDGVTITQTAKSLADVKEVDGSGKPVLDENGDQLVRLGVKSQLKEEVKSQQQSLLNETDWAIIRKADKGTEIPTNIQTYRDAIRTKATEMETAIDNAADTDAVAALFLKFTTKEDGSQTKTGILYDWPVLGD